jgi:two-component system sensor histidine kinase KdpD
VKRLADRLRGWLTALPTRRRLAGIAGTIALALGASTIAVAVLESVVELPDASAVYLLGVVAVASRLGTPAALAASLLSFLAYDFLFVQPVYTFAVSSPVEWLNLLLFLLVAIVVGRQTASLADREREASQRAREARVLFAISLDLAGASTVEEAVRSIVTRIAIDSRMRRVWCTLGSPGSGRDVADTEAVGQPRPVRVTHMALQRNPAGTPIGWTRVHDPGTGHGAERARGTSAREEGEIFTVPIIAAGKTLGALWAVRPPGLELPTAESTRFLAAAADQIGQAVERDRLTAEATNAEVARRSDRLKSALLDAVSHDLRTPLTAIRANAGSILDAQVTMSPEDVVIAAGTIEAEAGRMNRLIGNLLDLGRIEGGHLRGDRAPYEVIDLVDQVTRRLAPAYPRAAWRIDVPDDLPPVFVDGVWMDQVLTNLVENAIEHGGDGPRLIRVGARAGAGGGEVELTVEDDGRGVPTAELPLLFDSFHRVQYRDGRPARGMGIGLSVVRGLVEAMGGTVNARPSDLGGLAVSVRLPAADEPPVPADEPAMSSGTTAGTPPSMPGAGEARPREARP